MEFLSRNTPDFISPLLWPPSRLDLNPVDYEVWGVLQQRVCRSRIRDVDHLKQRLIEEGIASTRTSMTEPFDSGVFRYAHVSMQTAATLSTNCNWCFFVRTAKATFPYWKLPFLSSIFTALHVMQTRYCDEISVCLSVRPSVRLSHA